MALFDTSITPSTAKSAQRLAKEGKMESRSIAIGWRAALLLAFFAFVGGLLCTFVPDFILNAKFPGYTGRA